MKHDDVMRRLADARPAHLDPRGPVAPGVRKAELDSVLRPFATGSGGDDLRVTIRPADGTGSPRSRTGPRGRFLRPAWGLALAGGITALTLAVTVALPGTSPGPADGVTTAQSDPDGPSEVLLDLAATLETIDEDGTGAQGAYWYREELSGHTTGVPGKDYELEVRNVTRSWLQRSTSDRWTQDSGDGARPATEADREKWIEDGSPREWDLTDHEAVERHNEEAAKGDKKAQARAESQIVKWEGGDSRGDAPGGLTDSQPAGAQLRLTDLATLPTEPDALSEALLEVVDEQYNAPKRILQELVDDTVRQVALDLPSPPKVRAAAYRLMAQWPTVRDVGRLADHDGRFGEAIALTNPYGHGSENRMVFDPDTGLLLGSWSVSGGQPPETADKGEVTGWSVVVRTAWTDEAPPYDEDYPEQRRGEPDEGRNPDPADDGD